MYTMQQYSLAVAILRICDHRPLQWFDRGTKLWTASIRINVYVYMHTYIHKECVHIYIYIHI